MKYLGIKKVKSLRTLIPLSIALIFVVSCGKNETETLEIKGKEYYPLAIGKSVIYNVDSVVYDPQPVGPPEIDTTYWQFREDIIDTFKGVDGNLQYKIEISQRRRGTTAWSISRVLSASITEQYALRDDGNLRFIKFPFGFIERTTWDGNIFTDPSVKFIVANDKIEPFSKKWNYIIDSYGKPETIGGKAFDDVLTVVAKTDPKILTETRTLTEKYAKGVGLVFKELKILDTQKLDPNMAWEKKAEKGFIVRQVFVQ